MEYFNGKGECAHEDMLISFAIDGFDKLPTLTNTFAPAILRYDNLAVAARGVDNLLCYEIEGNISANRLIPELIEKQVKLLYGDGIHLYKKSFDGKDVSRKWIETPGNIDTWLESWEDLGSDSDYKEAAKAIIRRYYMFEDFFIRWRFFQGKKIGGMPIAFIELLENRRCLLASNKAINFTTDYEYKDFNYVVVGNWRNGMEAKKVYPKFAYKDVGSYYAAVSHHLNESVGQIYGQNKFYEGTKHWITGTNQTPIFLNSYRENSFAAKVHVVIPREWYDQKESQLKALCDENLLLQDEGKELLKYGESGIEIGTEFKQSLLNKVVKYEIDVLSKFLSGAKNQGKLYASFSYRTEDGSVAEWQINVIDLKSKEYVESQIAYDKRADDVILTAKGMDASLSNVSKDGIISKSGSDTYYNYLIYINSLTSAEETCLEPYNMALRMNFPAFYSQGYRFGYYHNVPQRQEDTAPKQRLQNTINGN